MSWCHKFRPDATRYHISTTTRSPSNVKWLWDITAQATTILERRPDDEESDWVVVPNVVAVVSPL
ncbi:hypothetical protein TIFTF001_010300 [Ficus carica]|uniref:Uncharacterized protein n=1 Tax=Ficus carica TaxID=3494 RepID=A0AA87ZRH0_FICCA|nr:hypothetical protein TIFTF001_010300 [Ficus carica]